MLVIQLKKTDYNTKIRENEKKKKKKLLIMFMINIILLQNLIRESFAAGLAQANLVSNSDIANSVNKTDFDDKLKN